MRIAIVEPKPSRNNYAEVFGGSWSFEQYSLSSDPELKKVLKKDVDIDMNPALVKIQNRIQQYR